MTCSGDDRGVPARGLRITCVHQGYELYGSDRCFIETVRAMRAAHPRAEIDVVLPQAGPIVAALEPYASRIVIEPLWILRRKNLPRLATLGMMALPGAAVLNWVVIGVIVLTTVYSGVEYFIQNWKCLWS